MSMRSELFPIRTCSCRYTPYAKILVPLFQRRLSLLCAMGYPGTKPLFQGLFHVPAAIQGGCLRKPPAALPSRLVGHAIRLPAWLPTWLPAFLLAWLPAWLPVMNAMNRPLAGAGNPLMSRPATRNALPGRTEARYRTELRADGAARRIDAGHGSLPVCTASYGRGRP